MNKVSIWIEFCVGIFVILVVASFVFMGLKVATPNFFEKAKGYEVTAKFVNIGGLKNNAKITMSGVVVGRVKQIVLDRQTFKAVAYFEIDNKYDNIPIDSSASILTAGILGEQYISIDAGAEDLVLQDGDEIALTQSAIILEDLINKLVTTFTEN